MSPAPRVGVLALQGDVAEHLQALHRVGAEPFGVRRPAELAAADGLVIPGGESTTMALLAEVFGLMGPLRVAAAAGLPVYGTCAGMILLADRLLDGRPDQPTIGGIDMAVRRNAFGRQVDSFEADLAFSGLAEPFHAVFIRAPAVEEVGPGVEVLARVGDRIVAVRQGSLLATSFHPEVDADDRIHAMFVDMVRAAAQEER